MHGYNYNPNRCVCCSLSDELFVSLNKLITRSKRKKTKYDIIVVENSGVAEPNNIRAQFHEAALLKHPLLEKLYLKTMITVVDSSRFFEEYYSRDTMIERPNLGQCSILPIVSTEQIQQTEASNAEARPTTEDCPNEAIYLFLLFVSV